MRSRSAGFIFCLLVSIAICQAHEASLTSTFGTASVDGTFSPGEWDSALRIPVFGESMPGSAAFIMNDEQNIYFAFQATDDTLSPNDTLAIRFDNAHNGTIDNGDDEILFSPANYRDTHYESGNGYGILDALQSGFGEVSHNGSANFFEVSHPLNSGEANDIAIAAGDTVGLAFRYSLNGAASADLTTFPPRSFQIGNRQLLFADLTTADAVDTRFSIVNSFAGAGSYQYDIDGTVGPNHYAELSNLQFTVYDKTGNVTKDIDDDLFWSQSLGVETNGFDPRLQFDHDSGRWFAVGASSSRSPNSAILVGVSATDDPTGDWSAFRIAIDPTQTVWADFPIMGIDGNAVYVTTSLKAIEQDLSSGGTLHVFPKADLIASMPSIENSTVVSTPLQRDVQIDVLGNTNDAYLQARALPEFSADDCSLTARHDLHAIQGASSETPTIGEAEILTLTKQTGLRNCVAPALARGGRQPGTDHALGQKNGDSFYRSGDFLYSVQSMMFRGARAIQWSKIDLTNKEIVDIGFIGSEEHDYLVPAIAGNVDGDVVISYSRSGPSEFLSGYASVGHVDEAGLLEFTDPILLKAGTDIYDEDGITFSSGLARWSDYSTAVTLSPDNPYEFWLTTGYVSDRNNASSWITQLSVPRSNPPVCDLNLNGACNLDDIDALLAAIGSDDLTFDLDGNGIVDVADVSNWLESAGNETIGRPFLAGDANLDGFVNAEDLNALGTNWQTNVSSWSLADFNGDGVADAADLNEIGRNWLINAAAPVPEPSGSAWLLVYLALLCARAQIK